MVEMRPHVGLHGLTLDEAEMKVRQMIADYQADALESLESQLTSYRR
jgi:hypothetical protein